MWPPGEHGGGLNRHFRVSLKPLLSKFSAESAPANGRRFLLSRAILHQESRWRTVLERNLMIAGSGTQNLQAANSLYGA
jgi:hypothetical protein